MQAASTGGVRRHRSRSVQSLEGGALSEQTAGDEERRKHLQLEAAHWGRIRDLMEGRGAFDPSIDVGADPGDRCGARDRVRVAASALVQRLADLSAGGIDTVSERAFRRGLKRAACEVLATLPELNTSTLDELEGILFRAREAAWTQSPRNRALVAALGVGIDHLQELAERSMMPSGCYAFSEAALDKELDESAWGTGRSFGLGLLNHVVGCAMEGRTQDLRHGLKALFGLHVRHRMPRESVSLLSIQLMAQCQLVSLAATEEIPGDVVCCALEFFKQRLPPLVNEVETLIFSRCPCDGGAFTMPLPETPVTPPLFERLPWWVRSMPNSLREGTCHAIALLFAVWAIQTAIETFVEGVGGHAWPPATIIGLTVALAFIGFDQFFQKGIVDQQAFRPQGQSGFGLYAKSKCFNLMRWTSLVQPWILPTGFFLFGLAAFDARAASSGAASFNGTSAFQPEPWPGSLPSTNASEHAGFHAGACEIAASMAMSTERVDYAWQCALIPVQAQLIGLIARPLRDLLQSGTRSRWTSGLALCRRIINAQGEPEFVKLTDAEQWKVCLLRDILYGLSSAGTLGFGQAYGKGLISLIQLRSCLAHEAIGIEFKSVYGPMNEAADGFWPDLANKLVEWWPGLVGLESPPDQPLVCVVDRQACIVGDEDGVKKFRKHFVRNAAARVATASVGNDAFGSLATLCSRLGYPEVEAFFFMVGAIFNALTGGARSRTANYLAEPDKFPHPDTVTRLAEVFISRGSSSSLNSHTPTPREQAILNDLERRHAIGLAFRSGESEGGGSTSDDSMSPDTSRESSQ